ncbi:MAG: DUF1349 domain-containing protein [Verrucomicrobia bacterium]|nr:DUF1349 domain-containing protein [Verrucomicrobiota bacterium]
MNEVLWPPQPLGHSPSDAGLRWLNPPARWRVDPESAALVVEPDATTDFWQRTHYGFAADNGHLLYREVAGNFVMTGRVRFYPAHQYDQAGLMVRAGPTCWLKTAVEHELAGPAQLGAVVTNHGYSDWSLQDFPAGPNEVRLRVQRVGADLLVEWGAAADERWRLLRVTHLHELDRNPVACGLYACSPKGPGFRAEFVHFEITA